MKLQPLALLGAFVAVAACKHDGGPFYPEARPSAFVRYVNAVPDTATIQFRFVDKVEGSAFYDFQGFRSISNYQAVDAGARHVKVFNAQDQLPMNEPSYVTIAHVDTTLTFEEGKYYTVLHVGLANGKQSFLKVIEDPRPSVPSGQIAVRVIHAGVGMGAVDTYAADATGSGITGDALFAGVTYQSATDYATRSTGRMVLEAADAGTTTEIAEGTAPAGALAASSSQSNQGGYSIGGSMLTAFIFPPSPRASLSASVRWMQDNRP